LDERPETELLSLPLRAKPGKNATMVVADMQKKNSTKTTIHKENLSLQLCAKLFCLLLLAPVL